MHNQPMTPSQTRIAIHADALFVDGFRSENSVILDSARSHAASFGDEGLQAWLERSLDLAARVESLANRTIEGADHAQRLDDLQQRMVRGLVWVRDELGAAVERAAGAGGTLPTAIARQLQHLEDNLDSLLAAEDGPLRAALNRELTRARTEIVQLVDTSIQSQAGLVHQVLSPTSESSPLRLWLQQQTATSNEIREQLRGVAEHMASLEVAVAADRAVRNGLAKSPAKGDITERSMGIVLARVAHGANYDYEATGRRAGQAGSHAFVGDHVIIAGAPNLPRRPRIAIECKDTAKPLTKAAWLAAAEAAMHNRDATAMVGLVPSIAQVPSGGRVAVLKPNVVVLAHDLDDPDDSLLVGVIRLMATQAAAASAAESGSTDLRDAQRAVQQALAELQAFDDVYKRVRVIQSNAEAITAVVKGARQPVQTSISRAQAVVDGTIATMRAA